MALVRKTISKNDKLTEEQIAALEKAAKMPIVYDEDCPELTEDELKGFRRVNKIKQKVKPKKRRGDMQK